jgi:diguanylate cyclase (GGDEF)-like protein
MTVEMELLRARFRASSAARVREMAALADALERDPHDQPSMAALARHFHGLAGLGATYGFPKISALADDGEATAIPRSRNGLPVEDTELQRWRELIAAMEAVLADGDGYAAPQANALPEKTPSPFRVLLVEDDPDLADFLVPILHNEAMQVTHVTTRGDAFEALADAIPDALIVDLVLPDGSGYDVVEALREMPKGSDTGAIVISAHDAFVDKLRAIRVGADAFEGKPLDIEALVRRLRLLRDRKFRMPERILTVEDDPIQAVIVRRILQNAGYEVAVCDDPSRFDEMLTAFTPDLLLMDVGLPGGVSGFDLVRYVRQNDRFGTLPVIFVTSEDQPEAIIRGVRSGGDDHLVKPVDAGRLLSSVGSRLERARTMRSMTERDALTGLLTRAAFQSRASFLAEGTLILIDVDRFKDVNDTHGHAAGDRVLSALGTLLRRGLRQTDLAARLGGDELVLLVEHAGVEEAVQLATRLLDEFSSVDHGGFQVTFSAGVAKMADSVETALAAADAAMYEAKRRGRAQVAPAVW